MACHVDVRYYAQRRRRPTADTDSRMLQIDRCCSLTDIKVLGSGLANQRSQIRRYPGVKSAAVKDC